MRLRFEPDDEDAFFEARDDLVERFERTPAGHDLGWVAAQVLDFKWSYLDGDLSGWEPDDIYEILLGLYPAKVVLDPEDLDPVLDGFAAFLRFLEDERVLERGRGGRLAGMVEQVGPQFRIDAMDEANWSMGKRLWSQARSEGVDPSDPKAVQRFMDDFNQRSVAERDAVLGPLPGEAMRGAGSASVAPFPPVVLAPEAELESAARASVWVQRLGRLVGFVGDGRPLTDKGNLKLADGKALVDILETTDRFDDKIGDRVFKTKSTTELSGVDLTFRMGLESGMLERSGKKVLPGPNAGWVDEPLAALYGAWLALLHRIGPTRHWYGESRYGWDWYAEELDAVLPRILLNLYREGEMPIDQIVSDVWAYLLDIFDLDDEPDDKLAFHRDLVERSLRRALGLLSELGTVRVEDVTEVPTKYERTVSRGGVVDLTPLGTWAVQRLASSVASAPVVGALRALPADELLIAVSDIPEAEAEGEIDAWIEHHGADAANELVEALRTADETGRGLGFRALLRMGPGAADAVDRLADDPELAPYATVWRIDTQVGLPEDMDCDGDPDRFVRLLGAVIELWGPAAAVARWADAAAGAGGLASMLHHAWRVKLPQTEAVLAAIGDGHADRSIAKEARTALFKHRSAR